MRFLLNFVLLLTACHVHALEYPTAVSWKESASNQYWFIVSREKLLPFPDPQAAVGMSEAEIVSNLSTPHSIWKAGNRTIWTYGMKRLSFFQIVFNPDHHVIAAHRLAYRPLNKWKPDDGINPGVGPLTNDPAYDIAAWRTMIGIDCADADHLEMGLNAARILTPGFPRQEIERQFGEPFSIVAQADRTNLIYRIGASDFLHAVLNPDGMLGDARHRHYSDAGRLINRSLCGKGGIYETPDLLFGDWRATTNRYISQDFRIGVGKQVEHALREKTRDEVLDLLGPPEEHGTRDSLHYSFSSASGMGVEFISNRVSQVRHYGM